MTLAAQSKRVACFIVGVTLLSGCAMRAKQPSQELGSDAQPYAAEAAQEGDLDSFLAASAVNSSAVVSPTDSAKSGDLALKLYNGADFSRVAIRTGEEVPAFDVTRLENPARLVLDLPNTTARLSQTIPVENSAHVQQIRLGAHQNKERIVLDLTSQPDLQHQVDVIDGALIVTVGANAQAASADLARFIDGKQNEAFASPDLSKIEAPAAQEVAAEDHGDEQDTHEGQESEHAAPDQNAKVEGLTPHLTEVAIEQVGAGQNRLVANVTSAGTFTLKRSAATEHLLTIEDAQIDANVIRSMVAPRESGAIRSARIKQDGGNVTVRIFSAPGVDLAAHTDGGKITVAVDESGPLAQAKEGEAAAEPKKDEGAETAKSDAASDITTGGEDSDLAALLEGEPKYSGRLISLDLQDTDIDNALRIIAEVSNLNIIASDDVTGKITLRLVDVPWDQALDVILKTNGLDKVQEGNVIRVAPVDKLRQEREALKEAQRADQELQPLMVRYLRISYARATDVKPLVETVLTERGSVAVDERTNQIIVKDIQDGITKVVELIRKLDLRTPQVLLETQIVEAQRNFLRDLGSEVGFEYIQSPETGNATGYNFPNSINVGGSVSPDGNVGSSFPASVAATAGSAISALFGSADGTKTLDVRLSALEQEGRIRIVSRPSVATINNKQAIIKSVEKIRVKTPNGGLSVATGQGASASGGSGVATETFEVGIVLEVTPQASPDFYVLLDINAKSSTLGATIVDGIPSEVERSANSSVLVASGQTFALGGIYKITDNDVLDGVPFLKDVPFLGHLFRHSKVDNGDEELIFFITPRIVEGSFDDAAMKSVL